MPIGLSFFRQDTSQMQQGVCKKQGRSARASAICLYVILSKNLTPHGNDKQSESSSVCSEHSVRKKIVRKNSVIEKTRAASKKICENQTSDLDKVKERIARRNIYQCYQCNLWEKKILRRRNFRDLLAFREKNSQ